MSALDKAKAAVHGKRQDDYGPPSVNHTRTAALWSVYLGVEVSARDVCWLNVLQKVSRDRHRAQEDTEVDVAGYAENAHLLRARTCVLCLQKVSRDRHRAQEDTGVDVTCVLCLSPIDGTPSWLVSWSDEPQGPAHRKCLQKQHRESS